MVNRHARPGVLFDHLHHLPEEIKTPERWLAPLSGYCHLGRLLGLDDLLDEGFHYVIRHAEAAARVKRFLGQEEAILTVQIADGAGGRPFGLGHYVEIRRRRFRTRRWRLYRIGYTYNLRHARNSISITNSAASIIANIDHKSKNQEKPFEKAINSARSHDDIHQRAPGQEYNSQNWPDS